jgi:hypothetical protein
MALTPRDIFSLVPQAASPVAGVAEMQEGFNSIARARQHAAELQQRRALEEQQMIAETVRQGRALEEQASARKVQEARDADAQYRRQYETIASAMDALKSDDPRSISAFEARVRSGGPEMGFQYEEPPAPGEPTAIESVDELLGGAAVMKPPQHGKVKVTRGGDVVATVDLATLSEPQRDALRRRARAMAVSGIATTKPVTDEDADTMFALYGEKAGPELEKEFDDRAAAAARLEEKRRAGVGGGASLKTQIDIERLRKLHEESARYLDKEIRANTALVNGGLPQLRKMVAVRDLSADAIENANSENGLDHRKAAGMLLKATLPGAPSNADREFILGGAGVWEEFQAELERYSLDKNAGQLSEGFVRQLREAAQRMKVATERRMLAMGRHVQDAVKASASYNSARPALQKHADEYVKQQVLNGLPAADGDTVDPADLGDTVDPADLGD